MPEDNAAAGSVGVLVVDINSDNEAERLHEPEAITVSLSDSADGLCQIVLIEWWSHTMKLRHMV